MPRRAKTYSISFGKTKINQLSGFLFECTLTLTFSLTNWLGCWVLAYLKRNWCGKFSDQSIPPPFVWLDDNLCPASDHPLISENELLDSNWMMNSEKWEQSGTSSQQGYVIKQSAESFVLVFHTSFQLFQVNNYSFFFFINSKSIFICALDSLSFWTFSC